MYLRVPNGFLLPPPAAQFGFLPLITGTLWVSLFAILLLCRSGFRFLSICLKWQTRKSTELAETDYRTVEWYSFRGLWLFGLIVIVPLIQKLFNLPVGESVLAGSIVLNHYGIAYHHNGDGRCDA